MMTSPGWEHVDHGLVAQPAETFLFGLVLHAARDIGSQRHELDCECASDEFLAGV
jgi:hypothetical protein